MQSRVEGGGSPPDGENDENCEASPPSIIKVINKLRGAYNKLNEQIVKAAGAVHIKNKVCHELREAIGLLREWRNTLCDEATATLATMRDEMTELKASMKEVKEATTAKAKTTYAYAAATTTTVDSEDHPAKCHEEIKQRRRALQITLDTSETSDEAKHMLKTQTYGEITKLLQRAYPNIEGFSRLKNVSKFTRTMMTTNTGLKQWNGNKQSAGSNLTNLYTEWWRPKVRH
jgi:hypothetical protein